MRLLILLASLLVSLCAYSQELKNDPDALYKRDMIITVNGKVFEGAGVISKSDKYDIMIEARGNLDLFTMTSCHKEETKERAWNVTTIVNSGLFGWGKKTIEVPNKVAFTYYPTPIEADGNCLLEFGGYEKEKGRHSWGVLDFEAPKYPVKARMECNGIASEVNGVAICQSRKGLIQRITFPEEMAIATNKCGVSIPADKKTFEYEMPLGKCSLRFMNSKGQLFKMTLMGYEKIMIRS